MGDVLDISETAGSAETDRQKGWVAAGGVLGAFAASSCCILPAADLIKATDQYGYPSEQITTGG